MAINWVKLFEINLVLCSHYHFRSISTPNMISMTFSSSSVQVAEDWRREFSRPRLCHWMRALRHPTHTMPLLMVDIQVIRRRNFPSLSIQTFSRSKALRAYQRHDKTEMEDWNWKEYRTMVNEEFIILYHENKWLQLRAAQCSYFLLIQI